MRHNLTRSVNIGPLIVLRIAFGLLMFISMVRFMAMGWIRAFYVLPRFHFTYYGFNWVKPLPEWGLWLVFITLALFSLFIAAGFLYRPAMGGFFLLFTYIELLDKSYYLNHYYFISLLSFLLIFLPLNQALSLDVRFGWVPPRQFVPAWMVWAVRLQLGLVYFFAGVAKINTDWLFSALPLRLWLPARTGVPIIGGLFDYVWLAFLMSWAGMLFDLTIFFWLSWPKTRLAAYLAVVVFHSLTGVLFNIGMFPWIMIACTLVFFDWTINFQKTRTGAHSHTKVAGDIWRRIQRALPVMIAMFLAVQLILPLRNLIYPGNVNWTEEGFRFAWRVMLVEKTGHVTFFVREPQTGRESVIYPSSYLTMVQERQMSFQPDMIAQFARYLASQYEDPVEVRAEAYVSWNGRPGSLLLNPDQDLANAAVDWRPKPWIRPSQQRLSD